MKYDFIVIGAGIAGASLGYELAARGKVCILEAEEMAGLHSTGRSAALLSLSYGAPAVRNLTRAARAFFQSPPDRFAEQPLLIPRGQLFVADCERRGRLDQAREAVAATGQDPVLLDKASVKALVPLLRETYATGAVLDPSVMEIDVDALHQGYLRAARARGAVVLTASRLARAVREGADWMVETSAGPASAPVLVNAAGAWADQVAEACGVKPVGLAVLRRTAILVDPPAGLDVDGWPAVMDAGEEFYFKPDAGKLLLSPADEIPDVPGDAQPEEFDVAVAVDKVQTALDLEVRRVNHRWAGLRIFAPDRAPVLGFAPDAEGFFWCAGQGGTGIQIAPALARTGAALILGDPPPCDLVAAGVSADSLSPARFC